LKLRDVLCTEHGLSSLISVKKSISELDISSNPISVEGVQAIQLALSTGERWHSLGVANLVFDESAPREPGREYNGIVGISQELI